MNNITFKWQKSEFYQFAWPFSLASYTLRIQIRTICGFKHLYCTFYDEISKN